MLYKLSSHGDPWLPKQLQIQTTCKQVSCVFRLCVFSFALKHEKRELEARVLKR